MAEGDSLGNSAAPSGQPLLSVEDASNTTLTNSMTSRQSPPKAVVDSSPLQAQMDKNKESLKVKLMVRRPINQLVEQGIMPPLKTSPALHEQRKQLERAKTGDLLRAKIQQRPDRQELERRHILEHDESHVDPSLAEKQRMLKKARLADQLNSQISHRPGPLELIKKNILHTEEPIERIVKEGLVSFKATSEGLLSRPQQPHGYINFEDDSQSSEGDQRTSPQRSDVIEAAAASAGIVTVALTIPTSGGQVVVKSAPMLQQKFQSAIITTPYVPPPPPPPPVPIKSEPIQIKSETSNLFAELCQSVVGNSNLLPLVPSPVSLSSTTSTLSPLSSVSSPPSQFTCRPMQSSSQSQKSDAPGKDKNRKKCKTKPVAKSRPIKFHEYKGPPSAQKPSSSSSSVNEETSYQLLLKQQTFLLEYLEGLHKNSSMTPANQKIMQAELNALQQNSYLQQPLPSPAPSVSSSIPASPAPSYNESISSEISKLEKMKVSDLKLLLKKRNLPVSGPKPQLIERLRPHLLMEPGDTSTNESISGETCDMDAMNSPHQSLSPESEHESMDVQQIDSPCPVGRQTPQFKNDDLLREQQRKIDELQRKLRESQEELLQMRQIHPIPAVPSENIVPPKPEVINQKMVFKQQLEAKIQKEKLQQLENQQRLQREHLAFQQAKNQGNIIIRNQNSPVLIAPKEEKPPIQLAFNNNPPTVQLANKKNVEIVWNGEPTLFLVNIPDNKRIINAVQQKPMPGILVPISAPISSSIATLSGPVPPPPPPLPPTDLTVNRIALSQPLQQTSPPPLQRQTTDKTLPQYEEAAKQLAANNKTGKNHIKSQVMTDVLEILIKNGELPETAVFDPATPTTPGTNINLTQSMIYQPSKLTISSGPPKLTMIRGVPASTNIENVEMMSPMQPDCENSVSSFDLFMERQQQEKRDQEAAKQELMQQQQSLHHQKSEQQNNVSSLNQQMDSQQSPSRHPIVTNGHQSNVKHFDDLELMDIIGMDIGDDQYQLNPVKNSLINGNGSGIISKTHRRDMNPSLQPSLNELIMEQQQQQQQQQSTSFNNNFNFDGCNNNNNFHSIPMDIEDFENSLSHFDFSSIGVSDEQINTPPHPFSQLQQQNQQQTSIGNSVDVDSYDPNLSINNDNYLDFFNIDDFKMGSDNTLSFGEVDFPV
ncbi:myocardin-related transcription factor B-like isoform X2 [Bradysia coprophila]|nr:myocardin-related transcription factor B-like isoform X2 [Bradysia coprophila]XP_037048919.1 myocardin-related transcription factor B-like isoform X2 [Bradysia coprophila]XP_037048920.1 myocardin-related transcription factor B-like isoform X2 [Bradysia coprophila]